MSKLKIVTVIALVAMVFVAVPGCGKKVTKVTEDKLELIDVGMTFDEVKDILGEPTDTEDVFTEIEGVATVTGMVCTWVSGDQSIIVTFDEDDRVFGDAVGEGF